MEQIPGTEEVLAGYIKALEEDEIKFTRSKRRLLRLERLAKVGLITLGTIGAISITIGTGTAIGGITAVIGGPLVGVGAALSASTGIAMVALIRNSMSDYYRKLSRLANTYSGRMRRIVATSPDCTVWGLVEQIHDLFEEYEAKKGGIWMETPALSGNQRKQSVAGLQMRMPSFIPSR